MEDIDKDSYVLDPGCGLGGFLKEYFHFVENKAEKVDEIPEKIWGFDIDPDNVKFASETLLDMYKNENLNIKPKIFELNALKPSLLDSINFQRYGDNGLFDYIIGNPPFFIINSLKEPYKSLLMSDFYEPVKTENINIATLFLFAYLKKLKPNGQLAFIFPRSLMHVQSFKPIREELLKRSIQYIFDLGKAFGDVGLQELVLIVKNQDPNQNIVHYGKLEINGDQKEIHESLSYNIPQNYFKTVPENVFEVFSGMNGSKKITSRQVKSHILSVCSERKLSDFCADKESLGIFGISRGLGIQKQALKNKENNTDIPIIGGRSIFNFGLKNSDTFCFLPQNTIKLNGKNKKLTAMMTHPKIMLQNLTSSKIRIVGFYDESPSYNGKIENNEVKMYLLAFDTITNIFLKENKFARFILAVLASSLIKYYLRDFIFIRQTLTLHLDRKYLKNIPIPLPTLEYLNKFDKIVKDLKNFVKINQKLTPVKAREIPAWEKKKNNTYFEYKKLKSKLDTLVFDLYQIEPQMKEYINTQLKEFEDFY